MAQLGNSKSPRIDMTPMVDLGFLLLTFFVLTNDMQRPRAMQIVVPADNDNKEKVDDNVAQERVLNILLTGEDRIYYYQGLKDPELNQTNFSAEGIRQVIVKKQKETLKDPKLIQQGIEERELIVMIKVAHDARHKNFVDIVDEMSITDQSRYMLVDITPTELLMVKDYEENQGMELSVEEALGQVPPDKMAELEAVEKRVEKKEAARP